MVVNKTHSTISIKVSKLWKLHANNAMALELLRDSFYETAVF